MRYQKIGRHSQRIKKRHSLYDIEAKSGHPGGSLSIVEILTVKLYFDTMNIDSNNPKMQGRDRFILSKGHSARVYMQF